MAYDEWIMKGNIPEPESIGAQETDVVNKHDNPWLQIEQLQMEIERLKRKNASLADMVALLGDAVTKSKAAF